MLALSSHAASGENLNLGPLTPRQCVMVRAVLDGMIAQGYWNASSATVVDLKRFVGAANRCDGPPSARVGSSKREKDLFGMFRVAYIAYEMCAREPDKEACAEDGSARVFVNSLKLPEPDAAYAAKVGEPMSAAKCAAIVVHAQEALAVFPKTGREYRETIDRLINGDGPGTCTKAIDFTFYDDTDDEKAWNKLRALLADERDDTKGTYEKSARLRHVSPAPPLSPK